MSNEDEKNEPKLFDLTPDQQAKLDSLTDPDGEDSKIKFPFDGTTEKKILAALLVDEQLLKRTAPRLNPLSFRNKLYQELSTRLLQYYKEYQSLPERFVLQSYIMKTIEEKDKATQLVWLAELGVLYEYHCPGLDSVRYLDKLCTKFFESQEAQRILLLALTKVKEAPEEMEQTLSKAKLEINNLQKQAGFQTEVEGYSISQLLELPPPEWLLEDHVPRGAFVSVFGPAKNYKSFITLDWALSWATGKPYLGRYEAKKSTVSYVCSEGGLFNFAKRIKCWEKGREVQQSDYEDNLQVFGTRFNFQKLEEADSLINASKDKFGKPADVYIIDTLSRNFGPADPNSNKDMQNFCTTIDYLREQTGATIIVVHHTGHGDKTRERSASNLMDSVEVSISVTKEDNNMGFVQCKLQKDAPEFAPYHIKGRVVTLGTSDNTLANSSLIFDLESDVEAELKETLRIDKLKEFADKFPTDTAMAWTIDDVATNTGWSRAWIQTQIDFARQEGLLKELGKGKRGNPLRYYKLTTGGKDE